MSDSTFFVEPLENRHDRKNFDCALRRSISSASNHLKRSGTSIEMLRLILLFALLIPAAQAQTLLGRATLPAATFVPGPTSGAQIQSANGVAVPFENKQPVQGFSSLQAAPNGDLWALSDNGFGAKANSADFLLRVHRLGRDFQTARGGSGKLIVKETIYLRDPNRKAGFAIVNENSTERRLTGADFDPESLVAMPDGDFYIGEEFGPFVLRFDRNGALVGIKVLDYASPDDPFGRAATIARSKGFEGLALSEDGKRLWAMLEGPVKGDDPRMLRFIPAGLGFSDAGALKRFDTSVFALYRLEDPSHAIGELSRLPNGKYLVIERDNLQGDAAKFKKIYQFDFAKFDENHHVIKRERADLLNIKDPDHLASDGIFRFPFQTIESVLPLDNDRVIVMNDNNYPFSSGRQSGRAEDTEAILIRLKP